MKITKFLFIFFSTITILPGCFAFKQPQSEGNCYIVDQEGNVCKPMLTILDLMKIHHDGNLSDIVEKTQKAWLRKQGVQRWEMDKLITQHDAQLQQLFHDMGLYKEILPQNKHFKYLLILGATFPAMEKRFNFAINLYKSGIQFDTIVLLAGTRPCAPERNETTQTFLKFCNKTTMDRDIKTEMDVLKLIYDYIDMPEAMRNIPVVSIDVANADHAILTTADIVNSWLRTNPTPGNCLAISCQPYVHYQNTVLKTLLPQNYPVETVGTGCAPHDNIAVMLDNLARMLYQELQYLQKKNL